MVFDNTTVFDFETTGLSPVKDRIIELAALRIRNGKVVGTFATTIHPDIPIPVKITELTGISDTDVEGQPGIEIVLPYFMQFIGNSVLVAHNAAFDLSFLMCKLDELKMDKNIPNRFIDTWSISVKHFPYKSHKLSDMCDAMGIKLEGAHRALNDVRATANLLYKLDKKYGNTAEFINKLYYYKKYSPPSIYPSGTELIAVG